MPLSPSRSISGVFALLAGCFDYQQKIQLCEAASVLLGPDFRFRNEEVTEVDKDTFWPIVEAAGEKLVILDMYTPWCGPCKVIAPKYKELSEKHKDIVFLKLDCNQDSKPFAKELGIKVVPTFKFLKNNKVIKEVTGAKFNDLVAAIETARLD